MQNSINFEDMQMKPLLYGLITQTVLQFNDLTMNICEGDVFGISFNKDILIDYSLIVTNVTFTNLKKLSSKDISKNGFIYKPAFLNYLEKHRNVKEGDSIVKIDFKLIENNCRS